MNSAGSPGPVKSLSKGTKSQKRHQRQRKQIVAAKDRAIRAEIDRDEQVAAKTEQLAEQKDKYVAVVNQYKAERDSLAQQVAEKDQRLQKYERTNRDNSKQLVRSFLVSDQSVTLHSKK